MGTVGFQTKLCKPRHPFTKGKVERLVRFVKENFLAGRAFWNVTDLNRAALEWCNRQNTVYHRALGFAPQELHFTNCAANLSPINDDLSLRFYLAPERKISFDGFVNYEGRRFGVPYGYHGSTARIAREDDMIYIYSADARELLATYEVTWSKRDRFCKDQYLDAQQPEEFPTAPVRTTMTMLKEPKQDLRNSTKRSFLSSAGIILPQSPLVMAHRYTYALSFKKWEKEPVIAKNPAH